MSIQFLHPISGDVLHARDGEIRDGALFCPVKVSAPKGACVKINSVEAVEDNGVFTATVPLKGFPTEITASSDGDDNASISVFVVPEYANKYRVSIDDSIWFLKDITENQYESLFESPFLSFFRELHEEYGIKLHINLYLEDIDSLLGEGNFSIREVPDRYKKEWKANADWIHLSFHAHSDSPDMPYKGASYEKVYQDAKAVRDEIIRFAGEEVLGNTTTLHWGEATMDGCRALRDLGWNILDADFNWVEVSWVSYYLEDPERAHIQERYVWYDDRTDVFFFRNAIILDQKSCDEIPNVLSKINENPLAGAYMDLLIHEQYFFEKYPLHLKDYREKVRAAVRWAVENGYTPGFLSEVLLGS